VNKTRSIATGAAVAVLLVGGIATYEVTSGKPAPTATTPTQKTDTGTPASTATPKKKNGQSKSSTSTPPTSAPVGFNSTRTAFVLPYNLGYLPAPELALAKTDHAYASGLAKSSYWDRLANGGSDPMTSGWFYEGPPSPSVAAVQAKMTLTIEITGWPYGPSITDSTNVSIVSSQLRHLVLGNNTIGLQGYTVVGPTALEVRAAPIGTLSINGVTHSAFCVPTPIADLQNGKIVTPPTWPTITAGPSVIASSPGRLPWVQGTSSCAAFH
jgi:hypothetical protein